MKLFSSIKIFLTALILVALVSCVSKPEKKIDSAYIMVYGNTDSGIMDAVIYMDDTVLGTTDIYGRFSFYANEKDIDIHTIRIEKDGYESISITTAINPGQLLYFRMYDGAYYAELAEKELDEGNINKAMELIEHALTIEERKDYQYLKKIINQRYEKWKK